MMKIKLQYGTAVAVLPAAALAVMDRATAVDLRVLLALCADTRADDLSRRAGCTLAQAEASLAFWRGAGILSVEEEGTADIAAPIGTEAAEPAPAISVAEPEPAPPLRRPDSLPKYSTDELTALLEKKT